MAARNSKGVRWRRGGNKDESHCTSSILLFRSRGGGSDAALIRNPIPFHLLFIFFCYSSVIQLYIILCILFYSILHFFFFNSSWVIFLCFFWVTNITEEKYTGPSCDKIYIYIKKYVVGDIKKKKKARGRRTWKVI